MTEGYQSYKKEPEHNNVLGFLSPLGFHNNVGSRSGSTPGEERGERRGHIVSRGKTTPDLAQSRLSFLSQSHTEILISIPFFN